MDPKTGYCYGCARNNEEKINWKDEKISNEWKVDWAMRWYALDVDFEMYGKDLIESAILSTKIIKILGKTNPSGFEIGRAHV